MIRRSSLGRLRAKPVGAFIWGVLLRLFYGSLALPVVWLLRPDLLNERRGTLLVALSVYLLVCLAGGAHDAVQVSTRTNPGSE